MIYVVGLHILGPLHGDSPEEGTSQVKYEQTNKETGADNWDLLSVNSDYSEEEECHRHLVGKEILRNMELNIEDEDAYLDLFKQLLQLEDYSKAGDNANLSPFSII